MAISGIFSIQNIYHQQLSNSWPTTAYVAPSPEVAFGWFGGGAPTMSTVDRIDYTSDTGVAATRGSLTASRYYLASTGNQDYGWFGGGTVFPTMYSTIDRITYSNDSVTTTSRGSLAVTKYGLGASGNNNYGWFAGGRIDTSSNTDSIVNRIDYQIDTTTASTRGSLAIAIEKMASTGNTNYVWFAGGGGAAQSALQKITATNDTVVATNRGNVFGTLTEPAGTGNQNYGWFIGSTTISNSYRVDYSSDTSTASLRGPMFTVIRDLPGATGNSNFGWFGGGSPQSMTKFSTVSRISYSDDTVLASIRGPLGSVRSRLTATGGFPG